MGFQRTIEVIQRGIEQRLHTGGQLYVSLRGQTLIDAAFGEARAGVAMTVDSMPMWMSSGKPIAAIAIAQLLEQKRIALDDRVANHIPEFGQHGKESITLRHLLMHTGGFRGPMGSFEPGDWSEQIRRACALKLEPGWIPGQKAGYHPGSSWFVLGELVRRLDGRAYDQYVRQEIFGPLDEPDAWVGMPLQKWNEYGDRIVPMSITDPAQRNVVTKLNDAEIHTLPRPGANARGPIRAAAKLYEALLAADPRLKLSEQTIASFTSRQRIGMFDHTFKCVLDWGLGFLMDSKQYAGEHTYGYGRHASGDSFGHSGNQSSCAFADPACGLVVAWLCNGMPGESAHEQRQRQINDAVYEDLQLDDSSK